MFTTWWIWVAAGFVIGAIEVVIPGFIFLGFAIGAIFTGILIGLNLIGSNIFVLILVFALASLIAWFVLYKLFGLKKGQTKRWDTDINA